MSSEAEKLIAAAAKWGAARAAAEAKRQAIDVPAALAAVRERAASLPVMSKAEEHAHLLSSEIFPRIRRSGWDVRFHLELAGDWGCAKQRRTFDRVRELCTRKGAIVALVGMRGSGKTTIGAQLAIARAWEDWESCFPAAPGGPRRPGLCRATPYRKLTDLLGRYKALYADFGTADPERLQDDRERFCTQHDLVVIDELHECDELRTRARLLTDFIDRRYAAKNDTVLISNQTGDDFKATIGDSVLSRIAEHGTILACNWGSWREDKKGPGR